MAALPGYDAILQIDSNEIEGVMSFDLSIDKEMGDITTFQGIGSNAVRKKLALLQDVSGTFSGHYDSSTGQAVFLTKVQSGADATLTFDFNGDATDDITITAKITNYSISASVDGVIEFNCTWTGNSAIS